ncbi:MAG: IPT/TIG domain-containing protein [Terracidiphilus sp.]
MRAFDATNLTDELWDSTQNLARDDVGNSAKFNAPTISNGKVYVGSFSGQLQVYGLNPPAFQGVQFVQVASATPQSTTASVPVAFSSPQTAGDLNVVIVGWNDTTAAVQSVTDSAGNTYTLALGPTKGTGLSESIYYAKNILASSANTVTVTFNQGATKPDVRILEYSGVATSNPLDVSTGASGNTYIADSGYVNTTAANELIVGGSMVQSNTTVMAGAPFTPRVITSPNSDLAADRLVNIPGSYHSWEPLNAAGNWVMQVVTFRSATASTVPFVSSVTPNSGTVSGGTAVTITGIDFAAGATVMFGSTAATNATVVNSTTITATAPAGSAGAVTVTVTNSSGLSGSLGSGFTYVAQPTVTGVSPNSGSTGGGTSVTITGTNFASGDTVTFGGTAATNVVVASSTSITATTPAGATGAVTVAVTNSIGQSGSLTSGFTYVVEPTVTAVSPNSGVVAGGTSVTITGTNFATGATVTFGSAAATNVIVVSSTSITATTPAGAAGAATVTVTAGGQSGSLASGFTYIGQPTVTGVSPNNGPAAGGTAVTITGTHFGSGATVTFGGTAATNVVVVSSTSITATTPAGSVGAVTVTVTNVGSQSGSLANGFTYNSAAAIGYVQVASATPQTASATVPVSYPAAQTAGDLNVVVIGWNDLTSTVQSVKDSVGNTYKLAVGPTVGTGLQQSIYYAANIAGGTNTITVTFSQAATFPDVRILEYRGVTALDVTAGTSGNSTSASSGAATTTSGNELIFGADTIGTTTAAAGTGFTARIITSPDSDLAEDKIVTSSGSNSATATLTSAGPWVMQMATFAAVAAPQPTVTSVSPNTGSTAGGTAVTITGTNFAAGATVTFGSAAATNVAVVNGTTITATTPAGTAGAATVTVTVAGQSGSLASGFTYITPPTVTSVSPNAGTLAGGTAVTITGTNFAAGATVTFGSTAATNVVVVSSTSITATTPAASAGAVTVTVTNSNGVSGNLASGFTFAPAPTVTGVSPNSGPTAGGTSITITGTNFVPGAVVEMVETRRQATNVVVVNSTTITAVTPTGDAGAETVSVSVNGQSGSLAGGFTYIVEPTVSSVSPSTGPTAGGTSVTITGTNFATGATVTFGSAAAANVVVVSSTSITATTPAGTVGAVTVTVTLNGQGGSLASGFTYVASPTVTSVSPNTGPTTGGTAVTITGTNFVAGATVTFGSTAAANVVVVSTTSITATTPAGSAGAVTVTVTNVGSLSGSLASGYTYVVKPTVTSVSPNTGPVAGGTSVTITGTNFATGATVTFGSAAATNVTVVSSTSITATTPAGTVGAATVTVTLNGQSGSLASGFTYIGQPTVTGVSPNNGPAAGGTAVTITGTNFASGATVTFGSTAATNVVVVSSTSITATTPAGSVGAVTVTVTNVGSQSGSLASGFTYNASVAISYAQVASATPQSPTATVPVSYPAAQTAGDLNVVVVGWNDITSTVQSVKDSLGNTYKLAVGPTVGTGMEQSIYYASNIAGGTNTVTVTFSQAAAYPDVRILEYRGVTALDVTAAATGSSASTSSGAATTTAANELIFGADLVSTTTTAAGSGFTSRIITTPDADIAEDKIVTAAGSNSATATLSSSGPWIMQMATFSNASGPQPTVTSVSPGIGPTAGGTAVTITGTNFVTGASVTIGGTSATNVVVVNGTTITATTPVGTAGAVAVTVNNPGGLSGSLASAFTYVPSPTVSSVSPNSGVVAGGTTVTITGTNFATGATVTFGSTAATNVVVVSSTSITATTPAGTVGAVTVTVTLNGQSGSLASGFTYIGQPTVTGVSPNSGSTLGQTAVTITGTNFASGATVTFGGTAATNVVVVSSTSITATTPAGTAGAVTVAVTNVGSQTGSLASGFTYVVTNNVTAPGNLTAALTGTSAPTYVAGQEYYNATPGTSFTSSSFNSSGANLLIMFLGCHNSTVFTITDSFGNNWRPLAGPAFKVGNANYPMEGEFFYVPNAITGAGHTITVGLSQTEPLVMSISALSGDNIYSPIDTYSSIAGDNGTLAKYVASGALTTSQPNDLLLGIVKGFSNNTYAAGSGFTSQSASTGLNFSAETKAASAAGNYASSFTASNSDFWQTVVAAIAPIPNESNLSWTASVGGPIANYFVERCAGLGCSNFSQIASVSGSTLAFTDTSIAPGTVYNYRVRAENTGGVFSGYSNLQAVSPIMPYVVSSFAATPIRTLSWNPSAESGGSISQYSIERCTGQSCTNFSQIATIPGTSYTDSSAAAGTTYNYRVRALDANGFYGPYSAVATASIPAYFDNAADGGNNGGSTLSLTYAYTVGSNPNSLLLVSLVGDTSVDDISSVKYASASMTLVKKVQTPSGRWHYLYSLLSPASGTNNVVITAASAHYLISEASSWYNAAQSGQPQAVATNTATTGASLTTSLPAGSSSAIVIESMWAPQGIFPGNGSSELLEDSVFQSLGMFSSIPSPVTSAFPTSISNNWGGQAPASSIAASFSLASSGTGAITYDNSADGGNNGGSTTSLTYPYTVGAGANRLLIVNLVGDTSADNISSVTYAGTLMTFLGKVQAASNNWQYLYYLVNPASGANNIVITAGSAHYLISQAASWYNVRQSAQPEVSVSNTAPTANTSITTSLTTASSGALVVQGIWSYGHLAAGAGATPIIIDAAIGGAGIFASSTSPVTPAGSVSMTTISDGSQSSGVIMASFAPAP